MPKLVSFDEFRAPWETEAGGDTEIDKPKLKRYIHNLLKDKESAQEKVAEVTTQRDELQSKVDAAAREGETETQKLQRENRELQEKLAAKPQGDSAETLKYKVALDKGLTAVQAKRLVGTTEEELAKDADELLQSFGGSGKPADAGDDEEEEEEVTPARQPRQVRNAADKSQNGADQEVDIEKALEGIPRINSF